MKRSAWIAGAAIGLAVLVIGCGASGKVDTAKLEQSFQSAAAGAKGDITQAVSAIKAGDFAKAVPVLQKVIKAGGLTDQQKDGISAAITGMQIVVAQNPSKYSVEVYNSLSDLVAYLNGEQPIARPIPR